MKALEGETIKSVTRSTEPWSNEWIIETVSGRKFILGVDTSGHLSQVESSSLEWIPPVVKVVGLT